jgi:hypothetical protein
MKPKGETMKILKCYTEGKVWNETTEEECLDHTELAGYWKPGSVLPMLAEDHVVHTPFARYKMAEQPKFVLSSLKSTFDGRTSEVIAIKYGERGYYPTTWGRQTEDWVKDQNAGMGVDQATVLAFDCCSLFGRWENFEKVRESMKRQLDKATKPMEAGNV